MSEEFNAQVKEQLRRHVLKALKSELNKHEKTMNVEAFVHDSSDGGKMKKIESMKNTFEQQRAGKAIVSHIESLIKLGRIALDEKEQVSSDDMSKQELLAMIEKAQASIIQTRSEIEDNIESNKDSDEL